MSLRAYLRWERSCGKAMVLLSLLMADCGVLGERILAGLPKGLPQGFAEHQRQLRELSLPPGIDRLGWLTSNLQVLDASCTRITSLQGLPDSLSRLNVSYTGIDSLDSLPEGLKSLDLRQTKVDDLSGLPKNLESLKISGAGISSLGKLPASLTELWIEDTRIRDLTGLPPRLKLLYLMGNGIESIDRLPASLRSLTLFATGVKTLKNLPSSLETLALQANPKLRFETDELPMYLSTLELINQQAPTDFSRLRYLTWLSDDRPVAGRKFPPFLSFLKIQAASPPRLAELPKSLRGLGLLNASVTSLSESPRDLEVLDLTGYRISHLPDLTILPSLKRLRLAYSSVSTLPELPAKLEELDLTGTAITDLRRLPAGLKILIFCDSPLTDLDVPPSLERLDLCGSRSLESLRYNRGNLKELNISGTKIGKLPHLRNIRDLDITNSAIRTLAGMPPGLESLKMSETQVNSVRDLPRGVKALSLRSQSCSP